MATLILVPFNASAISVDRDNIESIKDYAHYIARAEGLHIGAFIATIECESKFRSVQSYVPNPNGPNGREDSWGIAQIHLPSHPEITREQALDPVFSINWMRDEWLKGNEWKWTCYKTKGQAMIWRSQFDV